MGNSASKAAPKAAAAAGRRQYPSTSSILNSATSTSNAPGGNNTTTTTATPPTTNAPQQSAEPPSPSQVHPDPTQSPPTSEKTQHVELDGRDPQFGASLRKLGPAIPVDRAPPSSQSQSTSSFPTSSQPPVGQHGQNIFPSSDPTKNPSLMIVRARERIAQQWETQTENLGRRGNFDGRTLLGPKDLSEAIRMRDERGLGGAQVEKQMRLKEGVLNQLGPKGMVANATA